MRLLWEPEVGAALSADHLPGYQLAHRNTGIKVLGADGNLEVRVSCGVDQFDPEWARGIDVAAHSSLVDLHYR